MQTLIVRAATTTDIPALTHLWYEKTVLHLQTRRHFTLAPDGRAQWSAAALRWLADPRAALWVAQDAGESALAGYLLVCLQDSPPGLLPAQVGAVLDFAIDAHTYRGGVGRELARAARDWLREHHVERMMIDVPRGAAVEQAFWRALGAKEWIDRLWMMC